MIVKSFLYYHFQRQADQKEKNVFSILLKLRLNFKNLADRHDFDFSTLAKKIISAGPLLLIFFLS